MQRFLNLKELSLPLFWFPKVYDYAPKIIQISWYILSHKGASNLTEQKVVICPVIRLSKGQKIMITADREFHSIFLSHWFKKISQA